MADTLQTVVEDMQKEIGELMDGTLKGLMEASSDRQAAEGLRRFAHRLQRVDVDRTNEEVPCEHMWNLICCIPQDTLTDKVWYWCEDCGAINKVIESDGRPIHNVLRVPTGQR